MTAPALGLLLAGGRARRMGGGDKCMLLLGGRPLLARQIDRARPQVRRLLLNANGDPARFAAFGLPVVADSVAGFAGPLAGVLAGMEWAEASARDLPWVLSIASDTPFFPSDLAERLLSAATTQQADIAVAASGGRPHPVFALWPKHLAAELRHALVDEAMRKIDAWTARYRTVVVEFPATRCDPFFNVNTPQDLAEAERILAAGGG
jgi:molybdopterin-guanine dinucleotide biosynthesis protein A